MRLYETNVAGGSITRFLYDGAQVIGEYNSSDVLQRRFVPGAAIDEHVLWYEGSDTSDRRWFAADERGSIAAIINSSGAATTRNTFDEYGLRGGSNAGRFQYAGQPWLGEVSLYHYRARAYSPTLGRFMQTDPILHAGGMNLYAYVGNDPVNFIDPLGLRWMRCFVQVDGEGNWGWCWRDEPGDFGAWIGSGTGGSGAGRGRRGETSDQVAAQVLENAHRECWAALDDAAAQVWRNQQNFITNAATGAFFAGGVVASAATGGVTLYAAASLSIIASVNAANALTSRNAGRDRLGANLGWGAYGNDLVARATRDWSPFHSEAFTPPSQLSATERASLGFPENICEPNVG